jgi:hypothetical protein
MIVLCLIHLILALSLYTAPYCSYNIRPASWGEEGGWFSHVMYIVTSISQQV